MHKYWTTSQFGNNNKNYTNLFTTQTNEAFTLKWMTSFFQRTCQQFAIRIDYHLKSFQTVHCPVKVLERSKSSLEHIIYVRYSHVKYVFIATACLSYLIKNIHKLYTYDGINKTTDTCVWVADRMTSHDVGFSLWPYRLNSCYIPGIYFVIMYVRLCSWLV